jgi:predicted lysophospholipase L1 biosynthesis ABC-type transport system permease subunit
LPLPFKFHSGGVDGLTYKIPAELEDRAKPGTRVLVPLGKLEKTGVLVHVSHQAPEMSASMVVRTAHDPAPLVAAMHREVWAVDPNLPVEEWTLEWLMSQSIATSKFQTTLLVWFATVALLLAAMGVYALISYAVAQRTREIGVRMALGAARRDVVSMVLGQGVRLAVAGVVIGLVGAYYLSKVLTRVLYEVAPTDPLSHVAAGIILGLVAALATYIPARRAATVDPVVALRDER